MTIDFHAHILPEMDHGCTDIGMSLRQLELARTAGVDCVIATSHFYPQSETVVSFLNRRAEAVKKLQECMREGLPEVLTAAEVLLCEGMERMDKVEQLCVENTNVLLLEMPFRIWDEGILESLDAMQRRQDLQIVMAHIERYAPENISQILERRYKVQVNSNFYLSLKKRRIVRNFAEQQCVVALGSDIHGTKDGYKSFGKAEKHLEKLGFSMCMTEKILGWRGETEWNRKRKE